MKAKPGCYYCAASLLVVTSAGWIAPTAKALLVPLSSSSSTRLRVRVPTSNDGIAIESSAVILSQSRSNRNDQGDACSFSSHASPQFLHAQAQSFSSEQQQQQQTRRPIRSWKSQAFSSSVNVRQSSPPPPPARRSPLFYATPKATNSQSVHFSDTNKPRARNPQAAEQEEVTTPALASTPSTLSPTSTSISTFQTDLAHRRVDYPETWRKASNHPHQQKQQSRIHLSDQLKNSVEQKAWDGTFVPIQSITQDQSKQPSKHGRSHDDLSVPIRADYPQTWIRASKSFNTKKSKIPISDQLKNPFGPRALEGTFVPIESKSKTNTNPNSQLSEPQNASAPVRVDYPQTWIKPRSSVQNTVTRPASSIDKPHLDHLSDLSQRALEGTFVPISAEQTHHLKEARQRRESIRGPSVPRAEYPHTWVRHQLENNSPPAMKHKFAIKADQTSRLDQRALDGTFVLIQKSDATSPSAAEKRPKDPVEFPPDVRAEFPETWIPTPAAPFYDPSKNYQPKMDQSARLDRRALEGTYVPVAATAGAQRQTSIKGQPQPDQTSRWDKLAMEGTFVPIEHAKQRQRHANVSNSISKPDQSSRLDQRALDGTFITLHAEGKTQAPRKNIGQPDQSSQLDKRASEGTSVPIGVMDGAVKTASESPFKVGKPDQNSRFDQKTMRGAFGSFEPQEMTRRHPKKIGVPDQLSSLDKRALQGTFVPIGVESGHNHGGNPASTLSDHKDQAEQTSNFVQRACEGTSVPIHAVGDKSNYAFGKGGVVSDQISQLGERASKGTSILINSTSTIHPVSFRGPLASDQSAKFNRQASEGTALPLGVTGYESFTKLSDRKVQADQPYQGASNGRSTSIDAKDQVAVESFKCPIGPYKVSQLDERAPTGTFIPEQTGSKPKSQNVKGPVQADRILQLGPRSVAGSSATLGAGSPRPNQIQARMVTSDQSADIGLKVFNGGRSDYEQASIFERAQQRAMKHAAALAELKERKRREEADGKHRMMELARERAAAQAARLAQIRTKHEEEDQLRKEKAASILAAHQRAQYEAAARAHHLEQQKQEVNSVSPQKFQQRVAVIEVAELQAHREERKLAKGRAAKAANDTILEQAKRRSEEQRTRLMELQARRTEETKQTEELERRRKEESLRLFIEAAQRRETEAARLQALEQERLAHEARLKKDRLAAIEAARLQALAEARARDEAAERVMIAKTEAQRRWIAERQRQLENEAYVRAEAHRFAEPTKLRRAEEVRKAREVKHGSLETARRREEQERTMQDMERRRLQEEALLLAEKRAKAESPRRVAFERKKAKAALDERSRTIGRNDVLEESKRREEDMKRHRDEEATQAHEASARSDMPAGSWLDDIKTAWARRRVANAIGSKDVTSTNSAMEAARRRGREEALRRAQAAERKKKELEQAKAKLLELARQRTLESQRRQLELLRATKRLENEIAAEMGQKKLHHSNPLKSSLFSVAAPSSKNEISVEYSDGNSDLAGKQPSAAAPSNIRSEESLSEWTLSEETKDDQERRAEQKLQLAVNEEARRRAQVEGENRRKNKAVEKIKSFFASRSKDAENIGTSTDEDDFSQQWLDCDKKWAASTSTTKSLSSKDPLPVDLIVNETNSSSSASESEFEAIATASMMGVPTINETKTATDTTSNSEVSPKEKEAITTRAVYYFATKQEPKHHVAKEVKLEPQPQPPKIPPPEAAFEDKWSAATMSSTSATKSCEVVPRNKPFFAKPEEPTDK